MSLIKDRTNQVFDLDKALNNLKFSKSIKITVFKEKNGDEYIIEDNTNNLSFHADEYGSIIVFTGTKVLISIDRCTDENIDYYNKIREIVEELL